METASGDGEGETDREEQRETTHTPLRHTAQVREPETQRSLGWGRVEDKAREGCVGWEWGWAQRLGSHWALSGRAQQGLKAPSHVPVL